MHAFGRCKNRVLMVCTLSDTLKGNTHRHTLTKFIFFCVVNPVVVA